MAHRTQIPLTPAGAPLTSCDLDEACADLDCDAVMVEFGDALLESDDGQAFLAHYCGLEYVEKLPDQKESGK